VRMPPIMEAAAIPTHPSDRLDQSGGQWPDFDRSRNPVSSGTGWLVGRSGAVQDGPVQDGPVQCFRLRCSAFWVDVRLLEINGRWVASADTPNGPSLGCGLTDFEALWRALEPFASAVDELLASFPLEDQ
jgi:hypothetical protein